MKFQILCFVLTLTLSFQLKAKMKCPSSPMGMPKQLLVVITNDWDAHQGVMTKFVLEDKKWKRKGSTTAVVVGRNGLGWGRGFHPDGVALNSNPIKREGDGKAPAGVFSMSKVFGHSNYSDRKLLDYNIKSDSACIDDIKSKRYNKIVNDRKITSKAIRVSHENMLKYTGENGAYNLGITVNHNTEKTVKGAGSCIFLHHWKHPWKGTAGCTAMDPVNMRSVVDFFRKNRKTFLVQMPKSAYERLQKCWDLPSI